MECAETTWHKSHTEPPGHWHNAMVENMQKCDLIVFLAEYKEKCVRHLNEFRHVKHPANICHL